jgi:ABC-type multidrug transport system fused ATPase/permease subunit
LEPDRGEILISGLPPEFAVLTWPGALAYVPQDVIIINGTLRDNVGLGFDPKFVDDDVVWEALKAAQLGEFAGNLPDGLDTQVGERGTKLSGGQKQRLGIARALFTHPRLLVLDEATSSLDGDTEHAISRAINELKGQVTVIMIAHRLSTVRSADQIVYLNNGQVIAKGSFEDVRNSVPDFDRQARLMGL